MNDYNAKPELAKKLIPLAYIISIVVISLIVGMGFFKVDFGIDFSALPAFHSAMNTITFFLLLLALYFIKSGNMIAHKNTMITAMVVSAMFLVSYVLYHMTTPPTLYCKQGTIRTVYFIILNTHIVLAGIVFPFILISFIRGISYQIEKHKKLVRWVYPIWLYVAFTGPILYLMLRPCR